jgi:hypothetical protein
MDEVGMTNASMRNIRIKVAANTAKIIASAHSLTGDFLNGFCVCLRKWPEMINVWRKLY